MLVILIAQVPDGDTTTHQRLVNLYEYVEADRVPEYRRHCNKACGLRRTRHRPKASDKASDPGRHLKRFVPDLLPLQSMKARQHLNGILHLGQLLTTMAQVCVLHSEQERKCLQRVPSHSRVVLG